MDLGLELFGFGTSQNKLSLSIWSTAVACIINMWPEKALTITNNILWKKERQINSDLPFPSFNSMHFSMPIDPNMFSLFFKILSSNLWEICRSKKEEDNFVYSVLKFLLWKKPGCCELKSFSLQMWNVKSVLKSFWTLQLLPMLQFFVCEREQWWWFKVQFCLEQMN